MLLKILVKTQDNFTLKLELTAVKQERSHPIVKATTHELAKRLGASEKRFEVMEAAIGCLESTITVRTCSWLSLFI